jgi:hypothetical protein
VFPIFRDGTEINVRWDTLEEMIEDLKSAPFRPVNKSFKEMRLTQELVRTLFLYFRPTNFLSLVKNSNLPQYFTFTILTNCGDKVQKIDNLPPAGKKV